MQDSKSICKSHLPFYIIAMKSWNLKFKKCITSKKEILRYKPKKIGTGFASGKLLNNDEKNQRAKYMESYSMFVN